MAWVDILAVRNMWESPHFDAIVFLEIDNNGYEDKRAGTGNSGTVYRCTGINGVFQQELWVVHLFWHEVNGQLPASYQHLQQVMRNLHTGFQLAGEAGQEMKAVLQAGVPHSLFKAQIHGIIVYGYLYKEFTADWKLIPHYNWKKLRPLLPVKTIATHLLQLFSYTERCGLIIADIAACNLLINTTTGECAIGNFEKLWVQQQPVTPEPPLSDSILPAETSRALEQGNTALLPAVTMHYWALSVALYALHTSQPPLLQGRYCTNNITGLPFAWRLAFEQAFVAGYTLPMQRLTYAHWQQVLSGEWESGAAITEEANPDIILPELVFRADRQGIIAGMPVKLSWQINSQAARLWLNHDIGEVTGRDDYEVWPKEDCTYVLTAIAGTAVAEQTITIWVYPKPPDLNLTVPAIELGMPVLDIVLPPLPVLLLPQQLPVRLPLNLHMPALELQLPSLQLLKELPVGYEGKELAELLQGTRREVKKHHQPKLFKKIYAKLSKWKLVK